jgi:hypothetical protein
MSRVDELFDQYKAAEVTADPLRYLDQVEGSERQELAALIDAYLARQPRRAFDAAVFAGSAAERLSQRLEHSLQGEAGLWPLVLPKLRAQADLSPAQLAEQLADALEVPNEQQRVARYYEDMEHGLLPAAGVTDQVLDKLSAIVGTSADALRRAGATLEQPSTTAQAASRPQWDAVDELFRGGTQGR